MLIACPSCDKRYDMSAHPLPERGRKVRCAACGHDWVAKPEDAFTPQPRPYPAKRPEQEAQQAKDAVAKVETPEVKAVASAPKPAEEPAAENNSQDDIDALFGSDWDVGGEEADTDDSDDMAGWDLAEEDEEAGEEKDHPALSQETPGEIQPIDDADYDELHIADDGSVTKPGEAQAGKVRSIETLSDAERMAKARVRKGPRVKSSGPSPLRVITVAATIAAISWLGFYREDAARIFPPLAPIYASFGFPVNLLGLDFANVEFRRHVENGVEVLTIRGEVRNVSSEPKDMMAVRFALFDPSRAPLYEWVRQPDQAQLEPGEIRTFETRLNSPPARAADVELRFVRPRPIRTSAN